MFKVNKLIVFVCVVLFIVMSLVAGSLLAKNDPLETIKRTQDEQLQVSAAEFIQATVFYYSVHSGLPWFGEVDNGVQCFDNNVQFTAVPMNVLQPCVDTLLSENALQKDFLTKTPLESLYVTNPNPQTGEILDTVVCFQPQSETWQKASNTRYGINGEPVQDNRCHSQGGTEFCYWCTQ